MITTDLHQLSQHQSFCFQKDTHQVLCAYHEKDYLKCYLWKEQKQTFVMSWGSFSTQENCY